MSKIKHIIENDDISLLNNDEGFITGISDKSIGDLLDVDLTGIEEGKILKADSSNNFVITDESGNVEWDEIEGDQSDINLSGFTNDAEFITRAYIPSKTEPISNALWSIPGWTLNSHTNATTNDGLLTYIPIWLNGEMTFDMVGFNAVSSSGGPVRIGLYNSLNDRPSDLIRDFGTITVTSSGNQELIISPSLTVSRGNYYIAYVSESSFNVMHSNIDSSSVNHQVYNISSQPRTGEARQFSLGISGQSALVSGGLPSSAVQPNTYVAPTGSSGRGTGLVVLLRREI